ncbi:hypothetical protein [Winogradskyella sp. 3972H.M.0a.05]|uniref:hypothetical protein n=1 Tax=Winogradskyella sp. 3972H.M.0a.05 TaxID=2950277 RepID=UPI003399D5F9
MKATHLILGFCILFCMACSSEDENPRTESNDINISVDEYPSSGTFLSQITTSLEGTVSFTIQSQTSSQAIIITQNQLAVGDWLAFDFETNEVLEATVVASNGAETETINVTVSINDVDDIWAFLSGSSRTAYENASNGEWVMISESEYNDLANYLADTTKSGASDNQIFSGASVDNYTGNRTIANDNGFAIPTGSYVFAFKYYSWINNVVSSRVKISEGDSGGLYQYLGGMLPEHNDEFNHFVLKGVSAPTSSEGFIGMYASGSVGVKDNASSRYKWRNGDVDNLDNTTLGNVFLQQGLSTTLKQWD